eukprot:NODE_7089_length_462_cov_163.626536.p4 GENE.NODE_7089_length_462_cov_163.626536~~NODE_7089_length_462_cov_163.626536.p4  ORF type:complete len:51 (-),score=14.91 NODE_7089_length_462_cov_163.626536:292-444(-)
MGDVERLLHEQTWTTWPDDEDQPRERAFGDDNASRRVRHKFTEARGDDDK